MHPAYLAIPFVVFLLVMMMKFQEQSLVNNEISEVSREIKSLREDVELALNSLSISTEKTQVSPPVKIDCKLLKTELPKHLAEFVNKLEEFMKEDPDAKAQTIYRKTGAYPVSFSLPDMYWEVNECNDDPSTAVHPLILDKLNKSKPKMWSTLIPGDTRTYEFVGVGIDKLKQYRDHYSGVWKAHTWKKAGWDCNRHLEIMSCGAIPIFRDTKGIPEGVMELYPKKMLEFIENEIKDEEDISKLSIVRFFLLKWSQKYLTISAMAKYMARMTGIDLNAPGARALHIDSALPHMSDYLSAYIYGGLVATMGYENVDLYYHTNYLYKDGPWYYVNTQGKSKSDLYGGGYHSSHFLEPHSHKTQVEMKSDLDSGAYTIITYGCVQRSNDFLDTLKNKYKKNAIWLGLCDDAPTRGPVNDFSTSFVRELLA